MPFKTINEEEIKELTEENTSEELLFAFYQTSERIKILSKKNIKKHNVAAGIELRHELRSLKKIIEKLVKTTYESDKKTIHERRKKRKNELG